MRGRSLTLLRKQWRQQSGTAFACALLLMLFGVAITAAFHAFGDMVETQLARMGQMGGMAELFFGSATAGIDLQTTFFSIGFTHPLVLLVLCAFTIASASRSLAGEIERGTVDLLLSTPITRLQLAASSMAAFCLGAGLLLGAECAGLWLGTRLTGLVIPPHTWRGIGCAFLNSAALVLCVAGYSFACSAASSERGRAAALAAGITVVSYFLNVLAQLWSKVAFLERFSIFHYLRPLPSLSSGTPPWTDLALLGGLAVVGAVLGVWIFIRRDIATV
jgi:ABC-2 type transport system permease protein